MIEKKHIGNRSKVLMLSKMEHLLFWVISLAFFALTVYATGTQVKGALYTKLFFLPFQIFGAYFMIYILLGRYLYKGKYLKAVIGFIIFIFLFSFLVYYLHDYYFRVAFVDGFKPPTFIEMLTNFEALIIYYMNRSLTIALLLVCVEFVTYQYKRIKEIEQLQLQKEEAEFNLLKSQMHPNFLLSTLRNLEVLTENEPEKAPTVIEKLSETLDYILYKGQYKQVKLEEEINAIKEYIDIENIRFDGKCDIKLSTDVTEKSVKVIPLVVFSFLEYNFKQYQKADIPFSSSAISINQNEDTLFVSVCNEYDGLPPKVSNYELIKMKRQLEISYPDQFNLSEKRKENQEYINLELSL